MGKALSRIRKFLPLTLVLVSVAGIFMIGVGTAKAQTFIKEDITENTVWVSEAGPYIVAEDVTIQKGATLEIRPHTVVKLADGVSFRIKGKLLAKGKDGSQIKIKSQGVKRDWRIDLAGRLHFEHVVVPETLTVGFREDTKVVVEKSRIENELNFEWGIVNSEISLSSVDSKSINIWGTDFPDSAIQNSTVEFNSVSSREIRIFSSFGGIYNSTVEFNSVNSENIEISDIERRYYDEDKKAIHNSTVEFNSVDSRLIDIEKIIGSTVNLEKSRISGIKVEEVAPESQLKIAKSAISHGSGIFIGFAGKKTIIENNNIYRNDPYGLKVEDSWKDVLAKYNWWGDNSGPYHKGVNPKGEGDNIIAPTGAVDFIPWRRNPIQEINEPPTPVLKIPTESYRSNKEIKFDARDSQDDGKVVEYFFDFGDSENSGWTPQPVVTHGYENKGSYTASLKVRDDLATISEKVVEKKIKVKAGPIFTLENLSIDKKTVEPGGDVTISVNVKNEGKVGGSHLLELSLDGKIVDNKSVKLSAGQSDTVPFTVSKENTGSYRVSIGNQTGSFEVKKPSKFEITNYSMDRKIVKTGSTLEVSVVVKNVGNKKSSRSVVLYLDGEAVKSKPVSLEVGKSKSIAFKISENKIGSHKVSIGGYSENFRVLPPETFELRNKVENLKEEVEVRKDRIANLQGKIENLKEGVKAREDKLSDLQGKLEESRGELSSKKSKLRMVQNELEKERKEKEGIPMRWVVFGIFLALIVGLLVGRKT